MNSRTFQWQDFCNLVWYSNEAALVQKAEYTHFTFVHHLVLTKALKNNIKCLLFHKLLSQITSPILYLILAFSTRNNQKIHHAFIKIL